MKAVIPCSKKEDELYPLIETKPVGMMPVKGKPLVRHLVENLREAGIEEVLLVTNYREEMFEEEFGGEEDVETVTQKEINGVGGAVEECREIVEEDFVVVNGDVAVSANDLQKVVQRHQKHRLDITVLGAEDNTTRYGVLQQEGDRLEEINENAEDYEKVNTGVYAFSPEIFSILEELEGDKDLVEATSKLLADGGGNVVELEDYWIDVNSPRDLWNADQILREHGIEETEIHEGAEVHESADITGKAIVEEGAQVKPGTVLEGKVYIGRECVVGPNTVVRDSTVGHRSQVRASEIDSSLLFERNIIDSSTVLEDTVMGEETDVKSNTTIRESFIGPGSYVEMNNSIYGVKFVPDARTDLGEISK